MANYRQSTDVLDEILEEISKHPLLSVTRAISRGRVPDEDGRRALPATGTAARTEMDRRIHASVALDGISAMHEAVSDLCALASTDSPIHKSLAKTVLAEQTLLTDIEEADKWLEGFDDETKLETFVNLFLDRHSDLLEHVDTSPNYFAEFHGTLTALAIDAGMFDGDDPTEVSVALSEALVEFLPAIAKAGAALARGAAGAARTAAKTGRSFAHGFKKGYNATSRNRLGQRARGMANRVGRSALHRAARFAVGKLKKYADNEPRKKSGAQKPNAPKPSAEKPRTPKPGANRPTSGKRSASSTQPKKAKKPAVKPKAPNALPISARKGRHVRRRPKPTA